MGYLPTYWKNHDGKVLSEDKLIAEMLLNKHRGKVIILEDYRSRGAVVPFRHEGLRVIAYDEWVTGMVDAIHKGNSPKRYLCDLFCSGDTVCLPDLDLLCGKNATMELLSHALWESIPKTRILMIGNQLCLLTPYLFKLLDGCIVHFSICTDK